ncbi:J domain-containing protein [Natranaeroarchaeum aerophilus]|uniref:J domain-containing protein n=1 Tax=Natranaeroarchaeum aerophilus TaxID=2917711 RepID=A0AAE3K4F0_9EURY|nr:J domain-containing protein [Natranaeroarchaeum aerophilus]
MNRQTIGYALVFVFGLMAVLQTVLAIRFNLFFLLVAGLFGASAYLIWYHVSGRMEQQVRQEATRNRRTDRRGGFGAGPRERRFRDARRDSTRNQRSGDWSRRAPTSTDEPTRREAYRILDLGRDADRSAVRDAYREKVQSVHPDTADGDEEEFKRVTRAYERLTE